MDPSRRFLGGGVGGDAVGDIGNPRGDDKSLMFDCLRGCVGEAGMARGDDKSCTDISVSSDFLR